MPLTRSGARFLGSAERSSLCVKKTRRKLEELLRHTVNCRHSTKRPPISISVGERDVRSNGLAVHIKTDRAVLVGAVGFHTSLLQPFQYFAPWLSINISRAHRNDCVPWRNGW